MASQQTGEAYEQQNVHEVYQEIAQHFSATRYKVCIKLSQLRFPN
jgi:tRNA (uracil-5-)-methyltransferase TRM9